MAQLLFGGAVTTQALLMELGLAGAVVILAGWYFTHLADALADRLNLGAGWIGLILLASVTSLPELVTGGTATWLGNVDLAIGGVLGSCSFNITIIFLLNALHNQPVLGGADQANRAHTLSSSFGLLLITLALLGMLLMAKFAGSSLAAPLEWGWVTVVAVTYFYCMKLVYRYERKQNGIAVAVSAEPRRGVGASLAAKIFFTAVILVLASWWLARLGDVLSQHEISWIGRPLGATFVGACFLAFATSLPEIATSIAAVRLGKLDLALGNIFGSNMFNIFVIPMLKLVSAGRGDAVMLAQGVTDTSQNLIAGLLAILLTTVAIGGIAYQSKRRVLRRFDFAALVIMGLYLVGMFLLVAEKS